MHRAAVSCHATPTWPAREPTGGRSATRGYDHAPTTDWTESHEPVCCVRKVSATRMFYRPEEEPDVDL